LAWLSLWIRLGPYSFLLLSSIFSLFFLYFLILGIGVCMNQPKHVKEFSSCVVKNKYMCLEWLIIYEFFFFLFLYFPLLSFLSLKFDSYEVNLVMVIVYFIFLLNRLCFEKLISKINNFVKEVFSSSNSSFSKQFIEDCYFGAKKFAIYDRFLSFYQKRKRFCYILLSI